MGESKWIKLKLFWRFSFILCMQYVITAYIMNAVYQTDIGIGIVRQIITGIIALIFNTGIGIYIQNGVVPKFEYGIAKTDSFWHILFNIAISAFIFSLLNDLIAWKRIFTTFLAIISKDNFIVLINKFKAGKITEIISQSINDDKSFHVIIWISIILGLVIVNLNWIIGLFFFKSKAERTGADIQEIDKGA